MSQLEYHRQELNKFLNQWQPALLVNNWLPIGRAIPYAFENSFASTDEQRSMLETWFAAWAQLGWLCPPKSKKERMTQ